MPTPGMRVKLNKFPALHGTVVAIDTLTNVEWDDRNLADSIRAPNYFTPSERESMLTPIGYWILDEEKSKKLTEAIKK